MHQMSSVNEEKVAALGARVRGERLRPGWTLRDLETHSGLDHVRIQRIETDPKQSVRIEDILSLAKAFGVSGRWLIKGPEVKDRLVAVPRGSRTAAPAHSERLTRLSVHLDSLPS